MGHHLSLPRLLLRLSRYRFVLIGVPATASVTALIVASLMPDEYTAMARLLPPRTNTATAATTLSQIGGTEALGASALTLKSPSELYASLFLSRSVQDSIITGHKQDDDDMPEDMDGKREYIAERTRVEVREDGIIELRYIDSDPKRAAAIVNGMIDAVYSKAQKLSKLESDNRIAFYDQIIGETRQRLVQAETKLNLLESQTGYTRLKGQEEATSLTSADLESTLIARRTQLARMLTVGTNAHPSIRRIRAEIAALENNRISIKRSDGDTQQDQGVVMQISAFPDLQAQIEPARREARIQSEVLEYLMKARQLSRIDEKRDLSNVQVLDAAVPPTRKSGPRRLRNMMLTTLISFLLTLTAVLGWDSFLKNRRNRRRILRIIRSYATMMPKSNRRIHARAS